MEKRVLGVLGGRDLPGALFKLWAESSHILIAADSGADYVVEQGLRPSAIVGDMDSISPATLNLGIDSYRIDDQNYTDCDKLLSLVRDWGHRSVTLIGVEGDRLDHLIGTLHSCAKTSLDVRIAIRDGVGHVLDAGRYRIPATPGRRISLLPLRPANEVVLKGVRWPISNTSLAMGTSISLSNLCETDLLDLEFKDGPILVLQEFPHADLPIWPDQKGLAILRT